MISATVNVNAVDLGQSVGNCPSCGMQSTFGQVLAAGGCPNPACDWRLPPPERPPPPPLYPQLGRILTTYIFPTVILASILWAVFMGIQFGTATDEGKRKQVKDRFIKALATVVIIVVLYGIMIGVVPALTSD